jgi:ankyrin repeat protein
MLICEACRAGIEIEARDAHGMTPLLLAAHTGNTQVVKGLLQLGGDINSFDSNGTNVLGHACQSVRIVVIILHCEP